MEKTTSNKLFFICPFCQLEHFLRHQFGDVYFITAPAAVFDLKEKALVREIRYFITRRSISDLYTVCDLDCNFLNNALTGKINYGLHCEEVINKLKSKDDSHLTLAEKMVRHQVNNILYNSRIGALMGNSVNIHGIITSKKENKITYLKEAV